MHTANVATVIAEATEQATQKAKHSHHGPFCCEFAREHEAGDQLQQAAFFHSVAEDEAEQDHVQRGIAESGGKHPRYRIFTDKAQQQQGQKTGPDGLTNGPSIDAAKENAQMRMPCSVTGPNGGKKPNNNINAKIIAALNHILDRDIGFTPLLEKMIKASVPTVRFC